MMAQETCSYPLKSPEALLTRACTHFLATDGVPGVRVQGAWERQLSPARPALPTEGVFPRRSRGTRMYDPIVERRCAGMSVPVSWPEASLHPVC